MVESAKLMRLLVYLSEITWCTYLLLCTLYYHLGLPSRTTIEAYHLGLPRRRRFLRPLVYFPFLLSHPPTPRVRQRRAVELGFIRLVPSGPSSWRHGALCTFPPHPHTCRTRLLYYSLERSHAQDLPFPPFLFKILNHFQHMFWYYDIQCVFKIGRRRYVYLDEFRGLCPIVDFAVGWAIEYFWNEIPKVGVNLSPRREHPSAL